jgi:aspartyl-tRNA(Asn)/glutamyl-tRNA(Gln) amidotransferase subunit C
MAISSEDVQHVARLARLELTESEVELFRTQLSAVLERAQRIQSLPLDDVPPTAHPVPLSNVWRDDVVEPCEVSEAVLANAPDRDGGFFRVPRILEDAG